MEVKQKITWKRIIADLTTVHRVKDPDARIKVCRCRVEVAQCKVHDRLMAILIRYTEYSKDLHSKEKARQPIQKRRKHKKEKE